MRTLRIAVALCLLMLFAGTAWACQVPVFRYALEQWRPERYRILILAHDTSDEIATTTAALREEVKTPCAEVEVIQLAHNENPRYTSLWKEHSPHGTPVAVTLYPEKASLIGGSVAHVSAIDGQSLKRIVDSPVRREIAKRLSDGQSAVWVLLECSDQAKNTAAREMLEQQLARDAEWLELPSAEEMEIKPEVLKQVKVKLQVEFSLIGVSRAAEEEQFLVNCLLNSEADLRDFRDEPIAFPIFGRGLVLYALIGKGIAADTIRAASTFICGPCSCQVKEQNPGFDLLLSHDWEAAVGETKISQPIAGGANPTSPKLIPIPAGRKKK